MLHKNRDTERFELETSVLQVVTKCFGKNNTFKAVTSKLKTSSTHDNSVRGNQHSSALPGTRILPYQWRRCLLPRSRACVVCWVFLTLLRSTLLAYNQNRPCWTKRQQDFETAALLGKLKHRQNTLPLAVYAGVLHKPLLRNAAPTPPSIGRFLIVDCSR